MSVKRSRSKRAGKDETMLHFRVHTPNLLDELLKCSKLGVMTRPVQILGHLLACVAVRSIELDDPILNGLMCDLTLYAQADPHEAAYDQKATYAAIRKARKLMKQQPELYYPDRLK